MRKPKSKPACEICGGHGWRRRCPKCAKRKKEKKAPAEKIERRILDIHAHKALGCPRSLADLFFNGCPGHEP
jgi:hypothetical protein